MQITTRITLDMNTGKVLEHEFYEYFGPLALCIRSAANAAQTNAANAGTTAANLGAESQAQQAEVSPFYTQELHAEHGFDPAQTSELLTHALAGSGGATGALKGEAELQAARTRNPSGFTKSLDEISRNQAKAAAGASEGIAAEDVLGAKQLNQEGAAGLQGLYGENLKGQLGAMGQQNQDINTQVDANKTGWLEQMNQTIAALGGAAAGGAALKKAF